MWFQNGIRHCSVTLQCRSPLSNASICWTRSQTAATPQHIQPQTQAFIIPETWWHSDSGTFVWLMLLNIEAVLTCSTSLVQHCLSLYLRSESPCRWAYNMGTSFHTHILTFCSIASVSRVITESHVAPLTPHGNHSLLCLLPHTSTHHEHSETYGRASLDEEWRARARSLTKQTF